MDWIINEGMSQVKSSVMDTRNIDRDVRKLRNSLLTTNVLMDKAEWWRFKDENVDKLLTELVDARYDAKDLLEEFDYQKIKDGEGEGSSRASQILSPISNFSISNFAKGIISRMPNRVRDIQGRLDDAALKLENAIGILGSEYGPEHVKSVSRETSPLISEIEVFGRDEERNKVIEILLRSGTEIGLNSDSKGKNVAECSKKRRMRNTLSVLPIVGMGGVGKTTLAQFVYNDERVKGHFDLICWVCVSHNYDEKRIINEILESNHGRTRSNFTGLTALHENLRDSLMLKRFLIVLDDVWNENRRDWQSLCTPLRDGREGSMILLTTRSSEVAEITGTIAPIFLKGLACDIYWEFFKRCAFSSESSESHPELVEIGKKIAAKLNGSPLAAKTVGGLLSVELDAKHWYTILGSEIWKLKQEEFDILPALQLSYLYLPAHLKRCFAFCSMFPKNYGFEQERLVCMWVVNGLVSPNEGMLLEDIGDRYLNELIRRSFLQPNPGRYKNFLLHDLMHDLAQSVSSSECLCIQSSDQIGKLSETIRHLSVFCKPDELLEIRNMHKMHSLAFHQGMNIDRTPILGSWLRDIIKMTHLHMLMLLMCNIEELPQSFGDLKHLGYLDLQSNPITELPESLCQIYGLQFLSILGCPIRKLPGNFSKLINLKILDADDKIISRIPEIRKLTSLQRLYEFKISKENGREIMELKEMNQLRNRLNIKNLENVEDEETAAQANLINKKYLSHLSLEWSSNRSIYRSNNNACQKDEKVLGFLQPHNNLKMLTLRSYLGGKLPHWLKTKWLPCLVKLEICDCSAIKELTIFPSSLSQLNISDCTSLESLEECLSPHNLPVIKIISIVNCDKLESLPVEKFGGFSFLEELTISYCPKLICSRKLMLPSSLKSLALKACCGIDSSLPDCLFNIASLTKLEITHCPHITSLLWCPIIKLDELIVSDCEELDWLDRLGDPLQLKKLSIIRCPKLRVNEMLTPECGENGTIALQLSELAVSDISILRSPVLGNTIPCIKKLTIYGSNVVTLFTGEDNEILEQFVSLEWLIFEDCANLQLLELPNLNSLKFLEVCGSPELKLISGKGLPSLGAIGYDDNGGPVLKEFLDRNSQKNKHQSRLNRTM